MKTKLYLILTALFSLSLMNVAAQDCMIHLMVVPPVAGEDVPDASGDYLTTRLMNAVTRNGVTADEYAGRFFITGKFNHVTEDVVPGPPMQHALHTMLTLYIGDLASQKVFASQSFDLRGVGVSEQRAFINALGSLNARNDKFARFVEKGKAKVLDYFDNNYSQILAQASRLASTHNYEEALYLTTSIPECSVGYREANAATMVYYQAHIDFAGNQALQAARAAWAAQPDANGARAALAYLLQIDPESAAYPAAQALLAEIKTVVKDDKDFEMREKYRDGIDLERRRIEAARAVGVAFGRGQKPTTTNLMWLR